MFAVRPTKLIALTVAAIMLLFFLHYTKILSPFERGAIYLTKPILSGVYRASNWIGGRYLDFSSRQDLLRENKELKDQLAALLNEKSAWILEEEENDFLRSQLKFLENKKLDSVIARVIGQEKDTAQNTLIIDKGEKNGLTSGLPVLAGNGIMIGKIVKVRHGSASVLLLNDDLSKVGVKILNKNKTIGLAEGKYGLSIMVKLVPRFEMIKEGDIVVTSGLEENVPAGLLIGEVKNVVSEPEELFQEAVIEPLIDYQRASLVNVIKIGGTDND